MPLRTETTVEYSFNRPTLHYCETHDCLRVSEAHEDSVLLSGITRKDLDGFIKCYFEYGLEDVTLKEYFTERLKNKEAVEDE